MKNLYNVAKEKMSPELILEIILDNQRQSSQYDPEVDEDIELTFESTIDDWRYACDLLSWKPLGIALNNWFDINYSNIEWKNILEPSSERTLLELCTFIAEKATRNQIKSLNIFGTNCKTAGTFITIRKALKDIGIPTENIKPSSELKPLLIQYSGDFINVIGKLAPNVLPPIKIESTFLQKVPPWIILFAIISSICNSFFDILLITKAAYSLLAIGLILLIISYKTNPKDVTFGKLKTFADLCNLINKSPVKN